MGSTETVAQNIYTGVGTQTLQLICRKEDLGSVELPEKLGRQARTRWGGTGIPDMPLPVS